jgi:hypothetical protein
MQCQCSVLVRRIVSKTIVVAIVSRAPMRMGRHGVCGRYATEENIGESMKYWLWHDGLARPSLGSPSVVRSD